MQNCEAIRRTGLKMPKKKKKIGNPLGSLAHAETARLLSRSRCFVDCNGYFYFYLLRVFYSILPFAHSAVNLTQMLRGFLKQEEMSGFDEAIVS